MLPALSIAIRNELVPVGPRIVDVPLDVIFETFFATALVV